MNPAAPGTTIGRLRLRAAQAPSVRRALELADWPEPDGGAIVFVRRLAVRPASGRTGPQALAHAATHALAARLRAAVAADAPGAAEADAVRFTSAAALYAQLACDLAAGRAARCWYWARWRRLHALAPAHALAELLGEQVLLLGTITAELARTGALARLWPTLPPARATALGAVLAAASGWPAPGAAVHEPAPARPAAAPATTPAPPSTLLARWRPACRGLAAGDARVRLALFLLLLDWRPALLADAGVCARLADALVQPPSADATPPRAAGPIDDPAAAHAAGRAGTDPGRHGAGGSGPATDDRFRRVTAQTAASATPTPGAASVPAVSGAVRIATERRLQPLAASSPARNPRPAEAGVAATPAPAGSRASASGTDPDAGAPPDRPQPGTPASVERTGPFAAAVTSAAGPDAADAAGTERVETAFGGLAHLCNVLNHPRMQALAGGAPGLDALGGGWAAWLALGHALGLGAGDGFARYAERQWQRHTGRATPWTPRPGDAPLLALAAALCGPALWTPALIAGPGRLRAGVTHLDFERPLASVDPAVRRAGLDLDPGWLPWLGRVVAIHYREHWP